MIFIVLLLSKETLPRQKVPMTRVSSISHCHHHVPNCIWVRIRSGVTRDDVSWLCFHFLLQHRSSHSQQSPPTPSVTVHLIWPSDTGEAELLFWHGFWSPYPTPACFKMNPLHDVHTVSVFVLFWVSWLFKGNKRQLARDASRHLVCADWWEWECGAFAGSGADDGVWQLSGAELPALQGPSASQTHGLGQRRGRGGLYSQHSLLSSPHPQLSDQRGLFSALGGWRCRVGVCSREPVNSHGPDPLDHRDVSMLKTTVKYSSLSSSLLVLSPTRRLSWGDMTWREPRHSAQDPF